jgi:hypothetical protein
MKTECSTLTLLSVLGMLFLVLVFLVNSPVIAEVDAQLSTSLTMWAPVDMPGNVTLASPDLIVESIIFYPPNPAIGAGVDITVTVRNIGDASASGFYTYMYVDPIDQPPTSTTPYTSRTFWGISLVPGAAFQWARTGHIFTEGGSHSIYAWVDRDNDVMESDEENNLHGPIDVPVGIENALTGSINALSPYGLNGNWNMVYAHIRPLAGNPLPTPLTVQAIVDAVEIMLYDDGTHGDLHAGDGYYSNWFFMEGMGTQSVRLLVNNEELDSTVVEVINIPNLLVLTDIRSLYAEFLDTGTLIGEDLDGENRVDFYNLLDRLNEYASAHYGIVADIAQEITLANEFDVNYADLYYGASTEIRHKMGLLIDELIYKQSVRSGGSIQNIALIGNDQVLPFYRFFDPTDYFGHFNQSYPDYRSKERLYPGTIGGTRENTALQDIEQAYILTDVPYSIRSHQVITSGSWLPLPPFRATRPTPDMGIGRIFSKRPHDLTMAIDRYEEPLHLVTGDANALLFLSQADVDFSALAARSILLDLNRLFPDNLMVYDRQNTPWLPSDFVDSVAGADIVSMWGHATHINYSIADDLTLEAPHLSSINFNRPLALAGYGCHLGLSVSNYPDGPGLVYPFAAGMVNPLVEQGVTLFAPSSLAYTRGNTFPTASLHELMKSLFVNRLADLTCPTMGHVWQEIFPIYHATSPDLVENNNPATHLFHIVGAYGNVLYGLPTQPIERVQPLSPRILRQQRLESYQPLPASFEPLTLTIDIPYFEISSLEDGGTLFSVPFGGMHLAPSHGPVLPLVVRSLVIPDNIAVTDVRLTGFVTSTYSQPVTLTTSYLQTSNGELIDGSYDLPVTYPEENLHQHLVIPKSNGTALILSVVPLKYNTQTSEVTLYHTLQFEVDHVMGFPSGGPWLESVVINNSQPLRINQAEQMVHVEINSYDSSDIYLIWVVRDSGGYVIDSGRIALTVANGITTVDFDLDTTGWLPGTKDMAIYIQNGSDFPDSYNTAVTVHGIVLNEIFPQEHIYPAGAPEAFWHLYVRDENGVLLTNLASNFLVKIGVESVTSIVTQTESGAYEVRVPLSHISSAKHLVYIQTTDERGITGWRTWHLTKASYNVYLPSILRQ